MTIREYFEKLCANKLDNLDETDKFLRRHKQLNVTQEKIKHPNKPIKSKEIKLNI